MDSGGVYLVVIKRKVCLHTLNYVSTAMFGPALICLLVDPLCAQFSSSEPNIRCAFRAQNACGFAKSGRVCCVNCIKKGAYSKQVMEQQH